MILYEFKYNIHSFFCHFRTEIHDVYYYITVNVTCTCVQYLDVQTK